MSEFQRFLEIENIFNNENIIGKFRTMKLKLGKGQNIRRYQIVSFSDPIGRDFFFFVILGRADQ